MLCSSGDTNGCNTEKEHLTEQSHSSIKLKNEENDKLTKHNVDHFYAIQNGKDENDGTEHKDSTQISNKKKKEGKNGELFSFNAYFPFKMSHFGDYQMNE